MPNIDTNPITGDSLINKSTTDAYREGYDRIFGKKEFTLSKEQQAAVDDTAGLEEKNDNLHL